MPGDHRNRVSGDRDSHRPQRLHPGTCACGSSRWSPSRVWCSSFQHPLHSHRLQSSGPPSREVCGSSQGRSPELPGKRAPAPRGTPGSTPRVTQVPGRLTKPLVADIVGSKPQRWAASDLVSAEVRCLAGPCLVTREDSRGSKADSCGRRERHS